MQKNIEKIKTEIDRLVNSGMLILKDEIQSSSNLASVDIEFKYNSWYTEAVNLIKALLPERYDEFTSYFNPLKARKVINYETFRIIDYISRTEELVIDFDIFNRKKAFKNLFNVQISIVASSKVKIESTLADIKSMIQADLFDNELSTSLDLYSKQYYRAAGMIAGVVLESHLKTICDRHKIGYGKNSTISKYNDLLKANNIIETPDWRFIGMLGDYRNECSHAKSETIPKENVEELINGVQKIIKKVY